MRTVRARTRPVRVGALALVLAVSTGLAATTDQADAAEPYQRLVAEKRRPPAVPGPDVHLRVANLNALFTLSTNRFVAQLRMLRDQNPQVILLQEVAERGRVLSTWAKRNGYRRYLPAGPRASGRNQSVVLWKDTGRFRVLAYELRQGAPALTRPGGGHLGTRYLATVRVRDRLTRQRLSFTSTHVPPDSYVKRPAGWRPRWGSEVLDGVRKHLRAVRDLVRANGGALSIIGGDFNAPHRYEKNWHGYQTDRFGDLLHSNHQSLGRIGTLTTKHGWALDYVYANRKPRRIGFAGVRVWDTYSDHHALVVDFRVARR